MTIRKSVLRAALLGFISLILLSVTAFAQGYVFNAASFATGHNPQSVTNADLNADGRLDLVVANFDDGTVSVLLGTPAGTYATRVDYPTGPNPTAVLVGDFNGDTKLDLAVVNNNCPTLPCTAVGSVSVLLGNGDGTFQAHQDTSVGNSPNALAAADFNGDQKLDLLVTNGQDNTMMSLAGKGTGKFTLKKTFSTGLNPRGIALGDFSNRGFIDAVVANSGESDITLFRGKGDGTFSAPLTFPTAANPDCIAGVDFTGDGRLDVATGNIGSATVSILMNKDPVGFIPHVELNVGGLATGIMLGDLNGDGRPDIVTISTGPDAVSVIMNNGDASFQDHIEFATGSDPTGLTLGDFTGDGRMDLAITNNLDNMVNILPGLGNGTFQSRTVTAVGNMPNAVVTGDFNGDTIMDMAVANRSDNTVLILLGNGDGTFTPAAGSPAPTGSKPAGMIALDVNHDTILDLAVANSGDNTVSILLGNGNGTFQVGPIVPVGKRPIALGTGDFNRDGNPDLVVVNQNDPSISILTGNGTGGFLLTHSYFTGTGSLPTGVAVDDFIGNGRLDLAVSNGTGGLGVLLGFGDGTFTTMTSYAAGTGPSAVAIADLDGNGTKDVIVTNAGSNNVSILMGNNTGTFPTHVEYPTAKGPLAVAVADFNGDGKLDLAVSSSSSAIGNRVSILLGNGDGTFQPHVDHASKFFLLGFIEPLAVADFNNDLSPDFAVADQNSNSVSVFLNTPLPVAFPSSLNFGLEDIGVTSPSKPVILTNSGAAPLSSLAVKTSGEYAETNGCPPVLNFGEYCESDVTFTPVLGGIRSGFLTFTDNAPGAAQNVALTGEGNAPAAQLSVTSLTFGVTQVLQTSAKQNITLTNTSNKTLMITGKVTSDNFKETDTCGPSLLPGGDCVISIAFKPTDSGTLTGTFTLTDNAVDSPQIVSLTGTGTIVKLVPTSLGFGPVAVGSTGGPQTVTLTNVGRRPLTINSILTTGTNADDFHIVNNTCPLSPATLAKGTSCTFGVTFTPTQQGTRQGLASVTDDGGGSPQSVSLSGVGQ